MYWVDADIETDFPERKLYINSTVRAVDCDCEHVVQPVLNLSQEQVRLQDLLQQQQQQFI